MQLLTVAQAQHFLQLHKNNASITAQQVQALLANVRGVTFAQIAQVTNIACAAQHKHNTVQKVTVANVQLFNNLQAFTNAYTNAVQRSAAKLAQSSAANIAQFTAQSTYFAHTQCYSIVQHKVNAQQFYLFCIYNNAQSLLFINNNVASAQQVAQLLTASAAAKLLQKDNIVHNVTQNVTHNVIVRTPMLQSIVSITAQKQTLTV